MSISVTENIVNRVDPTDEVTMTDDRASTPAAVPAGAAWAGQAEYFAAYDAVLARWPVAIDAVDVSSPYGTTRVHICGPRDGEPLILLSGGGATSTVWFANVGELSRAHRVYAVDVIGQAGHSVSNGRAV